GQRDRAVRPDTLVRGSRNPAPRTADLLAGIRLRSSLSARARPQVARERRPKAGHLLPSLHLARPPRPRGRRGGRAPASPAARGAFVARLAVPRRGAPSARHGAAGGRGARGGGAPRTSLLARPGADGR